MNQNQEKILIRKASGETELFDVNKLKHSLRRATADLEHIEEIANTIQNWLYEGVTTNEIYTKAFSILHQKNKTSSLRYKLKQALLDLGPTGFPFECFISEIFKKLGFQTKTGIIVEGNCVTHEMDVIATKDNEQHYIECKYGNTQGKHVSVQVPLYVRSRVNDIIEQRKKSSINQEMNYYGWVATNTRFSLDSIAYGKCSGLHLIGWDYPHGNSLKEIIEREKIFPITILHQLDRKNKESLMEQGIVVCTQLLENQDAIKMLDLSEKELRDLFDELNEVCNLSPF